jgi:cysteinyl-tRNA synthetase
MGESLGMEASKVAEAVDVEAIGDPTAIDLFNTLSGRIEALAPSDGLALRMYACGPTVYDYGHIGNFRTFLHVDVLRRVLLQRGIAVRHVMNITDVDDKIIRNAGAARKSIGEYTKKYEEAFLEDMDSLGCERPEAMPRATGHIPEMVELIERLRNEDIAYQAEDGSWYFRIERFPGYGKLAKKDFDAIADGARVDLDEYDKDAARDFAVWKAVKTDANGLTEPAWETVLGAGRPGWHIECSAMSWRYLGTDFDIHGGGGDLIFPHHENELAQSCCAFPGSRFARVWLHNGMLLVNGEKMSKSLGNFRTVRDVLDIAPGEAIRFLLLRSHYRASVDFTEAGLIEARRELDRFYRALDRHAPGFAEAPAEVPASVMAALCDDLNTPAAIAALHALADRAMAGDPQAAAGLHAAGRVLGLLQSTPEAWFQGAGDASVEEAIAERLAARRGRDFARADAIRAELLARGIMLEDGPKGTTWRRVEPAPTS